MQRQEEKKKEEASLKQWYENFEFLYVHVIIKIDLIKNVVKLDLLKKFL